jgi:hypothetical protein
MVGYLYLKKAKHNLSAKALPSVIKPEIKPEISVLGSRVARMTRD